MTWRPGPQHARNTGLTGAERLLPTVRSVTSTLQGFAERAAAAGVARAARARVGPLEADVEGYTAAVDGRPLDLSPRQVELLWLFLAAPARVWSREQLHEVCWGEGPASRRVDVQLCRLRAKTGLDLFRNVRDRGWALRLA